MLGFKTVKIEQARIRDNFSRAAAAYDAWASHQKLAAARLAGHIPDHGRVKAILELGCGTGLLTGHLSRRFPHARITALDPAPGMIQRCRSNPETATLARYVETGAEDFKPGRPCDLVASSLSFQWFPDREAILHTMAASLSPGGCIALAVPLPGTLPELAESYRAATGRAAPNLPLWDIPKYRDAFEACRLSVTCLKEDPITRTYPTALEALNALKNIGASLSLLNGHKPLGAGAARRLLRQYETMFKQRDGRIPLTYKLLYMVGERS